MKNLTLKMNWILVFFALALNILWYFIPLDGEETGVVAAWGVHPAFGIFLCCILAYFFISLLISLIKKW